MSNLLDVLCNRKLLVLCLLLSLLWLDECWWLLLLGLSQWRSLFIYGTQSFARYCMKLPLRYMWSTYLSLVWNWWWISFHKVDFTSALEITVLTCPHIVYDLLRFWWLWSFYLHLLALNIVHLLPKLHCGVCMWTKFLLSRPSLQHLWALRSRHHLQPLLNGSNSRKSWPCGTWRSCLIVLGSSHIFTHSFGVIDLLDLDSSWTPLSILFIWNHLHTVWYLELLGVLERLGCWKALLKSPWWRCFLLQSHLIWWFSWLHLMISYIRLVLHK